MNKDAALLAIVGPTASGKSSLAIHLAKQFRGEILNCDSLQMYRHFDLGSAKLPVAEREGVPHHLLDILNPEEEFTAGEFARRAKEILAVVTSQGKLPLIVGGTGFYLRALLDGLFSGPARNRELRERLQLRAAQKDTGYLHRLLRRLDPVSAEKIHSNDTPKLIRALEVCLEARRPLSELFREGRDPLQGYHVLKLGLNPPRAELYEGINRRTRALFESGLVEEVRGILAKGFPKTVTPFQSHGYREALEYLEGKIGLEEAVRLAQAATRQYAKRQMTWFRKEAGVRWFSGFGTDREIQAEVSDYISDEWPDWAD
ncbi:MAG: tRNA (adenosine(37)-N6)-dimethylallyltransferase MiaA [Acidobacteriota bacterium]